MYKGLVVKIFSVKTTDPSGDGVHAALACNATDEDNNAISLDPFTPSSNINFSRNLEVEIKSGVMFGRLLSFHAASPDTS